MSAFHHLLSLLRAEAELRLPPAPHRLGVMHILLGTWGPPTGWLMLSLLQEGFHGCCTECSETERSPTVGGSNRQNQGLPCSASASWWDHWVTPFLIQCTREGLLPAAGRAPWEGQVGLQRNGMGGTSPFELLSHLALSAFSPFSSWSWLDHESREG